MELRLATKEDLPKLKQVFDGVVQNMYSHGITIWNEYYPYEEFEGDIENNDLYVLTDGENIVSAFGLYDSVSDAGSVKWEETNKKAKYLGRFGVNSKYLRQGIGSMSISYAKQVAKELGCSYLRLLVVDINTPAINLYKKNGFVQVDGTRKEYIPERDLTLTELGFETKI